jgi:RHS repeat-associated protein
MKFIVRLSCILCIVIFASSISSAQVQTGTPAFGSYAGGPDTVNLANLNDHWTFPIVHKPGRGTDFAYDLVYDSSIWTPVVAGASKAWSPATNWGWNSVTTFGSGLAGYGLYSATTTYCYDGMGHINGADQVQSNWAYFDPWGAGHHFAGQMEEKSGGCGNSQTNTMQPEATDGSGYTFDTVNGGGLRSKTNTIINAPFNTYVPTTGYASSVTDRNGNQISNNASGAFTDTLGKTALTISGSSPVNLTYTTSTGGPASYIVHYITKNIKTNFGCTGVSEFTQNSVGLVNDITLPDGSAYMFTYEATPGNTGYVTGRVAQVTLPTGGSIIYSYLDGSSGHITCADGSAATITRQTPDGTWKYARTQVSGTQWQTIVTDPTTAANQASIQLQGLYETQRKIYSGPTTGTVQQTINTCYNGAATPCTTTVVVLPITQRTVTATLALPGTLNLQSQHTDKFDSIGDNIESDDYDFTAPPPFPLLRQTLTTYASSGGNPLPFPTQVLVKDGSLVIKSRQVIAYDGSALTCVTTAPQHDNTNYGCSFTARFNATSTTTYTDPVTPSGAISKNFTYDSNGNLLTAQVNCCQVKTWAYSITNEFAYPDSVTSGSSTPQLVTSATYDLNMGRLLTSTDPNNIKTTMTYDNMGRPLTGITGTLPATNYTYTDSGNWSVKVCSPVQGSQTACQNTILDGLGRTKTVQLLDGSGILYSATDTQYDSLGRAYKTSNPYTGSATYWTTLAFDVLGRTTSTTLPDNSVSSISYSDNTVTTTDPANKKREAISDGLGHLKTIYEPDPVNGNSLTLQTSYTYNVMDQLSQVTQGAQTRTFVYDDLGRLNSVTTPEAGAVCLGTLSGSTCQSNGYDSWSNLLYRTDARGVVTNYLYDSLNRLVGITYPTVPSGISAMPNVCVASGSTNNANVCLAYGTSATSYNNGRVTKLTDASGSESYSYDQYGNATSLAKVIGTTTYTTNYAYNLVNQLSQITYPSGRVIAQNLDTLGRLSSIVGTLNSVQTTYASGFTYNAAQQTSALKYGNNLYASFGFYPDSQLLQCLDYSTTNRGSCAHDSTTKFGLNYSFPPSPGNNGQIASITDAVDNGRSAAYSYDSLYRLSTATTTGSTAYPKWGVSEVYDRYGNRSDQNQTFGSPPMNHVMLDATHNRISGAPYSYDLSGNMTNDGVNTLVYDGENRATSATNGGSSGAYTYDGNGLRIKKVSGGTTTVTIFSGGLDIAEYVNGAAPSSPTNEYVYSGTQKIALLQSGTTYYLHNDHLSLRVRTNTSGAIVDQRGHYPFGETWYSPSGAPLIFTSYYRDAESGNDFAKARSYVNRLGRFASVDPLAGSIANSQSLNRYLYTQDDPLNNLDPSGLCDVVIGGVTQNSLKPGTQAMTEFANQVGANLAFPYAGGSVGEGVSNVVFQGTSGLPDQATTTAFAALKDAIAQTSAGDQVNVTTFSGGAQAFNTAFNYLSSADQARIGNVTYISPGMVGPMATGSGQTTIAMNGPTTADPYINNGLGVGNVNFLSTTCSEHSSNCSFGQLHSNLVQSSGPACQEPKTFSRGKGGGPGGSIGTILNLFPWYLQNMFDFLAWVNSIPIGGSVEVVTWRFGGPATPVDEEE